MSRQTLPLLKSAKFWQAGILVVLGSLHLQLSYWSDDFNLFSLGVVIWAAVGTLLWERRALPVDGGPLAAATGAVLVILVLFKSAAIAGYEPFLRVSPLFSALGVGLLGSSFVGLWHYRKALFCLALLLPPPGLLSSLVDLTTLTAQFAASVLVHLGLDAVRDGFYIRLANRLVEVYPGCSGIESILHLAALAGVFAAIFPVRWLTKGFMLAAAMAIGFFVNGVRVAWMAYLIAYAPKSFEYWHVGSGSLIFSTVSVGLLGVVALFLLKHVETGNDNAAGY